MPRLNEVIAAILSSLSRAQHQSNLLSADLAHEYQNDKIMKYFSLPNATMSEAEINLRYAIKDLAIKSMPNLFTCRDISTESIFATHQRTSKIIDLLIYNEKFQAIFKDSDIDFQQITISNQNAITQVINNGNKNGRNEIEITKEIITILEKAYAKHADVAEQIQKFFSKTANSNEIIKKIHTYIKGNINDINNSTPKQQKTPPQKKGTPDPQKDVEIIIDNDILQKLPESIIQTIHFKVFNENYHWLETEDFRSGEFILTRQG